MTNLFDWNDQTWLLLDQAGILVGDLLMLLSIGGGIFAFVERNNIRRWLYRNRFPKTGGNPDNRNWRNVFFTVSNTEVPLWVIEQLQPQAVGLLATAFSEEQSRAMETMLQDKGIPVRTSIVSDPDDPGLVHRQARKLIEQIQSLHPGKAAMDITGGKTTMSLGAFMAAEEMGLDSIYVSTEMLQRRPDMSTARIITVSETQT